MTRSASTAIYLVRAENGLTKIGIAVSPRRRLVSLRVDSPIPLELVHMAVVGDAERVEAELHAEFAAKRSHGEWFRLTGDDITSIQARYPASQIAYSGDRHPVLLGLAPEDRDTIREAARMVGMSMAQFIIRQGLIAAEEKLRKDP